MNQSIPINSGWRCTYAGKTEVVDIPHTPVVLPLHYFDPEITHAEFTYERMIDLSNYAGKCIKLVFEGVSSHARLYINGKLMKDHCGAYLPFSADISAFGGTVVRVCLECSSKEDPSIPPYGGRMDYLSFCGMYREVHLDISGKNRIESVRVCGSADRMMTVSTVLSRYPSQVRYCVLLNGEEKYSFSGILNTDDTHSFSCPDALLWSPDTPYLYELKVIHSGGVYSTFFGFRTINYTKDGFFLNGKQIKLIGLNRHQSYPYCGYSMPGSFQRNDANLIKEMGANLVRCSHYPQHPDFLDQCDKIGLLVFEEIPGWQHISSDPTWRRLCVKNTEDMIKRDYNHPSIIMWGVRINESNDDNDLYSLTNAVAKSLDNTRPTGGVRCFRHSHLLEDVYTFNDFSHTEDNSGFRKKDDVTEDKNPYLVTEFGGHMFPTKRFDDERHRTMHALRTARCLNDMLSDPEISGCIAWCFSDYNTHDDFGSGDQICYHGMTDMFRIPKTAWFVYRSQQDNQTVMELSSFMNPGDHPRSFYDRIMIFTNADYVNVRMDGIDVGNLYPDREQFPALRHPPICITWQLAKFRLTRSFLAKDKNDLEIFSRYAYEHSLGTGRESLKQYSTFFKSLSEKYSVSEDEIIKLFNQACDYNENGKPVMIFTAFRNGEAAKMMILGKSRNINLNIQYDSSPIVLAESETYQVRQVNLLAVMEDTQMIVPYMSEPFNLRTRGAVDLFCNPQTVSMEGGAIGVYVRTNGIKGLGELIISSPRFGEHTASFIVK